MKKTLSIIVSILLIATAFTGCGASPAPGEQGAASGAAAGGDPAAETPAGEGQAVTWLAYGPGSNPTSWESMSKPILARYQEETGIEVVGEHYAFSDLFEVIEVKIASGASDYDVISVDAPMVAAYVNRGYLADVEPYFTDGEKAGFIESGLEAGSWQGTFYAPPMNTSSQLLFYNRSLLDEAGVSVPESTVENRLTWGQVTDMANQTLDVLDPDRNQGMIGIMFQQISRTYQMCAIPNSFGEKSIGDDGFAVDGVINSDGWIQALTWYQNLFTDGLSLRGVTGDEAEDYFASDRIIFMIGGTWTASDAQAAGIDFGYAPCPAFEGYEDKVATPTGSWHFGLNAASENKDAAGEFINWISIGEGNALWLEANNDVPSTKAGVEALTNDAGADEIMKIAAYEAANTAVPRALTPGYNEYSSVLDTTFEDIRNGTDVKTALDGAVSQINSLFERYQ